ncbi:MAG: IS1634 family transposase [Leptospirales bacterium]
MNKKSAAVHLVRIRKPHKGKVYTSVLLRRSFRDGEKVRSETLANLSSLPEETIDLIELSLKGAPLGRLDESITVVRTLPHGHVAAVLGTLRESGLEALLGYRRTRERDLMEALIVQRVLSPDSKLATARDLREETATTSLGEVLGVSDATGDELYAAMDRLLSRKDRIEAGLAKAHLRDGTLVLYDVSGSYYTGTHCELAKYGHNRDGKKRFPQIVYGLLCAPDGCPVAIEVFEGNTADPKTLEVQIDTLRKRFGLARVVLVTDRGILTGAQIDRVREIPGLDWITALQSPSIARLREQGRVPKSLFDQKSLAEVTSPDFPGERLVVCRNPFLAEERAEKREELLLATEKDLDKIVAATRREKRPLKGRDQIALRVGRWVNRHKMAKHFELAIEDESFSYRRKEEAIREEAALDGLYVIRTSVPKEAMTAEETVGAYKSLAQVERAFRSLKTVDLEIRPIYHRLSDRVKGHVFLCMLAYYVEWQMKRRLAPLLYAEEDREGATANRESIVAPSVPSDKTRKKAHTHRTEDGLPVQSFRSMLRNLGTLCRNVMRTGGEKGSEFSMLTQPSPLQQKAFSLLGLSPNL